MKLEVDFDVAKCIGLIWTLVNGSCLQKQATSRHLSLGYIHLRHMLRPNQPSNSRLFFTEDSSAESM